MLQISKLSHGAFKAPVPCSGMLAVDAVLQSVDLSLFPSPPSIAGLCFSDDIDYDLDIINVPSSAICLALDLGDSTGVGLLFALALFLMFANVNRSSKANPEEKADARFERGE